MTEGGTRRVTASVDGGFLPEQLARRVACELREVQRVWVAPQLPLLRSMLAASLGDEPFDVVVLAASQLAQNGDVRGPGPGATPQASRVWAILDTPMQIVNRCTRGSATVERAFASLGVIEVTSLGLVVCELAPGFAATDMQKLAEPTLKISSRVAVMRDNVPASLSPQRSPSNNPPRA